MILEIPGWGEWDSRDDWLHEHFGGCASWSFTLPLTGSFA